MKVIYIEKDKMRQMFVKGAIKNSIKELFIIEDIKDEFYVLIDIVPDLVLLDFSTVNEDFRVLDKILNQVELKNSKIVIIGENKSALVHPRISWLSNPLSLNEIVKIVKKS